MLSAVAGGSVAAARCVLLRSTCMLLPVSSTKTRNKQRSKQTKSNIIKASMRLNYSLVVTCCVFKAKPSSSFLQGVRSHFSFAVRNTRPSPFLSSLLFASTMSTATTSTTTIHNPLLTDWSLQPFQLPPFQQIQVDHFAPALQEAMQIHLQELEEIAQHPEPSFESTIAAFDRAGALLDRVTGVYSNLCSSQNPPELQAVQTQMAPLLSRHASQMYQIPGLFTAIDRVYQQRDTLQLTSEQQRLVERIHLDFVRAGAALSPEQQSEVSDIQAQLATLQTQFQQNVMAEEASWTLEINDWSGCPASLIEAAKAAAEERGHTENQTFMTLSRSMVEPFLTYSDNRRLRQQVWEAWVARGEQNNLALTKQILQLRQRLAQIHGYPNFAAFQCADRMAQTPEKVNELLENVWIRAKEAANQERKLLEKYVEDENVCLEGGLQAWDWRFYAEKVRQTKYDLDESLLRPYFTLDAAREALFAVSNRLFGLTYTKRPDLQVYHPDVDVYEVREEDRLVAIFLHDNFARSHKSGGAWMSEFRSQSRNLALGSDPILQVPIVINNNNFAKGSQHTFLSYDDCHTLFHEFGHAHHGMLSNADYGRLASTNVLTDFVELPSQLMEHWFDQTSVLKQYCKHYETGESIPDDLLEKLRAARSFQQGFRTVEYSICALLDMKMHQLEDYTDFDMTVFEKQELERLGMPPAITMRHRPAHFSHLFATSMYAAGYYVYQWAEVLDADAFAAFEESGNVFDPAIARKAREFIYGAGNTRAPEELFRSFRGRDPKIDFMLKKKGLVPAN